ncbi:helix-turn-helix domain-containing protein [Enterococcus sp. CWB-B31]|uniref:helix-turn-helix domain-containing protein n=1 Tax=Enterococcus sp. CWB-B31 TaxID=2885159 RepID=UPI001E3C1A31|nr:helix-turn-helix transcriptional regulator [Enterococcus sp. CWB-B31]MCB5953629.1 helix-turn-helix domain-containing protein [Enterococcus sp. CWB-B31]
MDLGNRLKEKRAAYNFTQQELADKMHVSRQTISNWEVGRSYPDIESLIQLSELFSISLDALLKGDKKMVTSLKRKNIWEVLYMVVISSLAISSIICAGLDFIYTQELTWSLIVFSGCLIAGGVATVLRYAGENRLIKCGGIVTVLIVPLLLAIAGINPHIDLTQLFRVTAVWVVYVWILIALWKYTSIGFWWLISAVRLLSFAGEYGMLLLIKDSLTLVEFLMSNIVEIALFGLCAVCGLIKVDGGRMDKALREYRYRH